MKQIYYKNNIEFEAKLIQHLRNHLFLLTNLTLNEEEKEYFLSEIFITLNVMKIQEMNITHAIDYIIFNKKMSLDNIHFIREQITNKVPELKQYIINAENYRIKKNFGLKNRKIKKYMKKNIHRNVRGHCSICLSDIRKQSIKLTCCNQYLHRECFFETFGWSSKCPYCRHDYKSVSFINKTKKFIRNMIKKII